MPLNEMAYAVKEKEIRIPYPSRYAIRTGKEDSTIRRIKSVVKLTSWLLQQFHLDTTHILRHYDITGKDCPKYYVDHEDAWEQFKADVGDYMAANPNIQ